jgi:hypothetical protein
MSFFGQPQSVPHYGIGSVYNGPRIVSKYDIWGPSTDSTEGAMVVSGAGDQTVDGIYIIKARANNLPVYQPIGRDVYFMRWDVPLGNRWIIYQGSIDHQDQGFPIYRSPVTSNPTPDIASWSVISGGTFPAPTVSAL